MRDIIKKIKVWFVGIFDKDKGKKEPNPERGWKIILLMFFFAVVLLFIFSKNVFGLTVIEEETGISAVSASGISLEKINKTSLAKMLEPWDAKRTTFEKYVANRPSFDFLK